MSQTDRMPPKRRWQLLALTLIVLAMHAWFATSMTEVLEDSKSSGTSGIQRMEAAYVRELKLSAPPLAPPSIEPAAQTPSARAPKTKRRPARPPVAAASSPASAAQEASQEETETVQAHAPVSPPSEVPPASISAPPAAAASAPTFTWPLATRVSYQVRGYFRGELYGKAKVEWVRQGTQYQVHVDTILGPSFAPIGSWHLISAGNITPEGLAPSRFEQVNRLLIKTSTPKVVAFEDEEVVLNSGERLARTPGMQDAASQFIQLPYQFMLKPDSLRPGHVTYMTIALPKRVEKIAYDVLEEQVLNTPMGEIQTFHIKPRKADASAGSLPVEMWLAPSLQYLPVRILVRTDEKSHLDLQMERAPEQNTEPAKEASPTRP